jgi:hypothetical protein
MVDSLDGKREELAMTSLPITRGTPRSTYSAVRTGDDLAAHWLHGVVTDRNLVILAAFSLIGLLVTLNLIFRFASFQPSLDQIAQILG